MEDIARTKRDELAIVVADLAAAKQAADSDGKIAAAQAALDSFHHERVRPAQGGRTFASDMHAGFCSWCRERGLEAPSLVKFRKMAAQLYQKGKVGGRVVYLNVAVIPVALSA